MANKIKRIVSLGLSMFIVMMSIITTYDIAVIYAASVGCYNQDCVLQANNIRIDTGKKVVNGLVEETDELCDIADGILSQMDNFEYLSSKGDTEINISNQSYCIDELLLSANSIEIATIVVSSGNINLNAQKISGNIGVVYSQNGDVNFAASDVSYVGIIYAPNGTVRINCNEFNFQGCIIAKEIIIQCSVCNISSNTKINEYINIVSKIKKNIQANVEVKYDIDNNKFAIDVLNAYEIEYYVRVDDSNEFCKYEKIEDLDIKQVQKNVEIYAQYTYLGKRCMTDIYDYIYNNDDKFSLTMIDTDGDGLKDGYEIRDLATDPNMNDTDGDGFDDFYEVSFLLTDPKVVDENYDLDGDGLSNKDEYECGLNPFLRDSDYDGISDEIDNEPLIPNENNGQYSEEKIIRKGYLCKEEWYYDADGKYVGYIYDLLNNRILYYEADSLAYTYVYGMENRPVAIIIETDDNVTINSFSYNEEGNKEVINHNGTVYKFEYIDGILSKVKVSDYLLENTLESNSELCKIQYQDGVIYTYYFDEEQNLSKVDKNGNILYEYEYDEYGNPKRIFDHNLNQEIIYEKNESDLKYTTSNGLAVLRNYESDSREYMYLEELLYNVTKLDEADVTKESYSFGMEYEYDDSSENIIKKTFYINDFCHTTDARSGEFGIKEKSLINGDVYNYKYDNKGNVIEVYLNEKLLYEYKYNNLGYLVEENSSLYGYSYEYKYDNSGNIIEKRKNSEDCITYEYDKKFKDLLIEYDGTEILYNDVACPTKYINDYEFVWGEDKRITKILQGNKETQLRYSNTGKLVSVKSEEGEVNYEWYNDELVYMKNDEVIVNYIYSLNGELLGFRKQEQLYLYEYDGLGSIVGICDENGNTVVRYGYDAYGNVVFEEGDVDISECNPFGYRGYFREKNSGLYLLGNRYYDAEINRFINPDSHYEFMTSASCNQYCYCINNPNTYSDETGNGVLSNIFKGIIYVINTVASNVVVSELIKISEKLSDIGAGIKNSVMTTAEKTLFFSFYYLDIYYLTNAEILENFEKNSTISFEREYINGQAEGIANEIMFGMHKSGYNGCGWIATFNLFISIGGFMHPKHIVKAYELENMREFSGTFGIMPNTIIAYSKFVFSRLKPEVHLMPDMSEVEAEIKKRKRAIMFYTNVFSKLNVDLDECFSDGYISTAVKNVIDSNLVFHYVFVEYNASTKKYIIYNEYNRVTIEKEYDSFSTHMGEENASCVMLVTFYK